MTPRAVRSTVIVKLVVLVGVLGVFGYLSVLLLQSGVWPLAVLAGCMLMAALGGLIVFDLIDTWQHPSGRFHGTR